LPATASSYAIFYNEELLESKGISSAREDFPKTWPEPWKAGLPNKTRRRVTRGVVVSPVARRPEHRRPPAGRPMLRLAYPRRACSGSGTGSTQDREEYCQ